MRRFQLKVDLCQAPQTGITTGIRPGVKGPVTTSDTRVDLLL